MRVNVTYTTDFVRKERPGADQWEDDEVVYYECPNCLDTCDAYAAEERGDGVHTITECFETLRERITKGEKLVADLVEALASVGTLVHAEPEPPRVVSMGKARGAVKTLAVRVRRDGEADWQERNRTWIGTVEQLAARIERQLAAGHAVHWDDREVTRQVDHLRSQT